MHPQSRAALVGFLVGFFVAFVLDLFGSLASFSPYQPNFIPLILFGIGGAGVGIILTAP